MTTPPARRAPARGARPAIARTGVATKVISRVGVERRRRRSRRARGPARARASVGVVAGDVPARAAQGQADRAADQAGADDAGAACRAQPPGRSSRRPARLRGTRGAARAAALGGEVQSCTRMHSGVPPARRAPRADQRHVAEADRAGRRGRERRADVVGGGEQDADEVVVVDAVALEHRLEQRDAPARCICSASSRSTVVAPRRARTAAGTAGEASRRRRPGATARSAPAPRRA